MKPLMTICASVVLLAAATAAMADDLNWKFVPFDSINMGAVSYDASGGNVVVGGTAFRDALGSILSVQQIGGDGINNPVTGNFGFFGVFSYTDNDNVLVWAQSIMTTPLAIEITAHTLNFEGGLSDYFALDARDMPDVDYLQASFADLAAWGCTEIADGYWMDVAVDTANSQVAISIVVENFVLNGYPDLDLNIVPGDLDGEIPGQWRASGLAVAAVPEPATLSLLAVGLAAIVARKRNRK